MSKIKASYVGAGFLHGIPARDLLESDWRKLSAEQQQLVKGSALYKLVQDAPKEKNGGK